MRDVETLKMDLVGYEVGREKIDSTMAAIRKQLGCRVSARPTTKNGDARPKRRKLSAAGRARIVAAQRKRWAAVKTKAKGSPKSKK